MGFSSLKALTNNTVRPFDKKRNGLVIGDGAFSILLGNKELVKKLNATPTASLSGWGISNDANHITGPARDGCGLIQAIKSALKRSCKKPENIEAYCTHGTGTVYNDAMELTAIESIFGIRKFPAFSVKGSLGHTLGAAGGIETCLCIQALKEKQIPPTTGFQEPEERALGRISSAIQNFNGNNILTTNSGFGGINAALILEKE